MNVPQDASDQVLRRAAEQLSGDAIHVAVPPFAVEGDEAFGNRLEHGRLASMRRDDRLPRAHLRDVQARAVDCLRALMRERVEECQFLGARQRG